MAAGVAGESRLGGVWWRSPPRPGSGHGLGRSVANGAGPSRTALPDPGIRPKFIRGVNDVPRTRAHGPRTGTVGTRSNRTVSAARTRQGGDTRSDGGPLGAARALGSQGPHSHAAR